MTTAGGLPGAVAALAIALGPGVCAAAPLSADDCVKVALQRSARVRAARADAAIADARADQVESSLSTKIEATTYVAPLFGATGGLGYEAPYKRDFGEWGPYAHGEVQAVKPLSTFGRLDAGIEAARGRAAVEHAKVRLVQGAVRRDVRKLYGLRLYAMSMVPNLENGREILAGAIDKAQELYDSETGEVTLADIMKLRYGAGEIERFLRQANDGVELAGHALRQAMGLPMDAPLELADSRLQPADVTVPELDELVAQARTDRPEVTQIDRGIAATQAWERSEAAASRPTLFAAAVADADWTNVRPTGTSSVLSNDFNDMFVGVALGLRFDLDFAKADTRAAEARAKQQWVRAQAELAKTGLPLQVFKARQELLQHIALSGVAKKQVKHTRKWMTFSAAAHVAGTGEAKDVLEGVGAFLLAKKNYYDHLLGAWQARAALELAVGVPPGAPTK